MSVAEYTNWQARMHELSSLPCPEAREMLSYLGELEAEVQGSLRACRNRISALKDIQIATMRAEAREDALQRHSVRAALAGTQRCITLFEENPRDARIADWLPVLFGALVLARDAMDPEPRRQIDDSRSLG